MIFFDFHQAFDRKKFSWKLEQLFDKEIRIFYILSPFIGTYLDLINIEKI